MHYHRLRKLNFCVRDGNRCDLSDMVAGKTTGGIFRPTGRRLFGRSHCGSVWTVLERIQSECKISMVKPSPVSTGKINTLPCLHVQPINLVVFYGALVLLTYES